MDEQRIGQSGGRKDACTRRNPCCGCCCFDCCLRRQTAKHLAEIVETVALMEASLSHILNTEGEKMQRILQLTDQPCQIMEANQSINATLTRVTHLEIVLYDKLRLAEDMRENCGTP